MLEFSNLQEEKSFLDQLRKKADGVQPPPSLDPDRMTERLPDRKIVPLAKRIAPYGAIAACLAVVLAGMGIFYQSQRANMESTGSASSSVLTYSSSSAAASDNKGADEVQQEAALDREGGDAEAGSGDNPETYALMDMDLDALCSVVEAEDYLFIYEEVADSYADNYTKVGEEESSAENVSSGTARVEYENLRYSLEGNSLRMGSRKVDLNFPLPQGGGSWTAYDLLLWEEDKQLVVLGESAAAEGYPITLAAVYDLSNPLEPVFVDAYAQSGGNGQAMVSGGKLCLLSQWTPTDPGDGSDPARYVPAVYYGGSSALFFPEELALAGGGGSYLVLITVELDSAASLSRLACWGTSAAAVWDGDGIAWNGRRISWADEKLVLEE